MKLITIFFLLAFSVSSYSQARFVEEWIDHPTDKKKEILVFKVLDEADDSILLWTTVSESQQDVLRAFYAKFASEYIVPVRVLVTRPKR